MEFLTALRGLRDAEDRAFTRAGTVAAMVIEVNRDSKRRRTPYTAEDIFPHLKKEKTTDTQTAAQQQTMMKVLSATNPLKAIDQAATERKLIAEAEVNQRPDPVRSPDEQARYDKILAKIQATPSILKDHK